MPLLSHMLKKNRPCIVFGKPRLYGNGVATGVTGCDTCTWQPIDLTVTPHPASIAGALTAANSDETETRARNSLSLLVFEKELGEKLDSDEIINAFKAEPRRFAL